MLINTFLSIIHFPEWDKTLFLKINTEYTNPIADALLPIARNAAAWIPLYIFLLLLMLKNFGWKSWTWLLFAVLSVVLSDQLSSTLIKEWISRIRPCNEVNLQDRMRLLLNYRPQSGSFTSSHAANHFALATYFILTLRKYLQKWIWLFLIWAIIISYAQIYVGVHYPLDIFGGAILGTTIGCTTHFIFKKYFGMPPLLPNRLKNKFN